MDKRTPIRGSKMGLQNFFSRGGGRVSTLALPPCGRPCVNVTIQCTIFSIIIHHIIISKYTLECTQLNYFLKIFSEEHTLESSINKTEQRYTHHTIDNASGMYYSIISKVIPPCLNIDKLIIDQ